jgi:hypothetical protein
MSRSAWLAVLLLSTMGCSVFAQLRVEPIAASFQKPSNVAVYVAVTQRGKPLGELQPESFRIYENGLLSPANDTQQLVLPQELSAYHHTVLLVDVSGENASLEPLARFRDEAGEDALASFSPDLDAIGFGPGGRSESAPRFVVPVSLSEATPKPTLPAPAEDEPVVSPPDKPGYAHWRLPLEYA